MRTFNQADGYYSGDMPDFDHEPDLAYKDEVVTRLQEDIEEYLTFSTTRDLVKLIADLL